MLTRSPATIPSPLAPIVTAASPVNTPARAMRPGRERLHAVDQRERCSHSPLGVILVSRRRSPDGHHRVADELLDRAAVALDDLACLGEVAAQQLACLFGITILGQCREADEVSEED